MEGLESGSVWPASTFDEEQIREVYSRYGLAMYMVQVLEHGMVNAGIIMRTLGKRASYPDEDSWLAAFDASYETGLAKTYGNMLDGGQVTNLQKVVESHANLQVRTAAAEAAGALNLPPDQAKTLIINQLKK